MRRKHKITEREFEKAMEELDRDSVGYLARTLEKLLDAMDMSDDIRIEDGILYVGAYSAVKTTVLKTTWQGDTRRVAAFQISVTKVIPATREEPEDADVIDLETVQGATAAAAGIVQRILNDRLDQAREAVETEMQIADEELVAEELEADNDSAYEDYCDRKHQERKDGD